MGALLIHGATIFDGAALRPGSVLVEDDTIAAVLPADATVPGARRQHLSGGILAPGFVDLQVNGGGGVMFNDAPEPETLVRIAEAHARLGALSILPTLITDTAETTRRAVAAVSRALAAGIPGIVGLHLEGPHLSQARKGAHDPALIRPMAAEDLGFLCDAARSLPVLKITIAPECVDNEQISKLADAGALISLGHTDAGHASCVAAVEAGARVVTHLFNAMSPLAVRDPGLVGAALGLGALSAGVIADGIHVHPATLRIALAAKAGPGALFLVSDAMATAGSEIDTFTLNGREIRRAAGRLTLADGTLAGADLDLAQAIRVLTRQVGATLVQALSMATSIPADVAGIGGDAGRLLPGRRADLVHLSPELHLSGVWRRGEPVAPLLGPR